MGGWTRQLLPTRPGSVGPTGPGSFMPVGLYLYAGEKCARLVHRVLVIWLPGRLGTQRETGARRLRWMQDTN